MPIPADNAFPCAGCRALNAERKRELRDAARREKALQGRVRSLEFAILAALKQSTTADVLATLRSVLRE